MAEAKDIDDINNLRDMLRLMDSLHVPCGGLQTLDEMKQRVKETLKMSEKKSSWTAKQVGHLSLSLEAIISESRFEQEEIKSIQFSMPGN